MSDEGRSFGVGLQGQAPNHLKRLLLRVRVVSVEEKARSNSSGIDVNLERRMKLNDLAR